jgi:hypothetical protein
MQLVRQGRQLRVEAELLTVIELAHDIAGETGGVRGLVKQQVGRVPALLRDGRAGVWGRRIRCEA